MEKLIVDSFTFEHLHGGISRVTWKGEASEAAILALRDFGNASAAAAKGAMVRALVDAREATGFSRAARKQLTELGRDKPWDRVAFIGVRYEVRVMLELMAKGMRLMKLDIAELAFVDSEAEALAWLARE